MTQEDKKLLLKDLCSRLPYSVCVHIRYKEGEPCYGKLTPRDIQWFIDSNIKAIKPYLRPMSSMTEEEEKELSKILNYEFYIDDDFALAVEDSRYRIRLDLFEGYMDWLLAHHFDYRGLIEKGLALEAPEEMYKENKV